MRLRPLLLLLILILPGFPHAAASSATAIGAEGPDADGAFRLVFDVHMDAPRDAALAFEVARTDANGTVAGARDLGVVALAAGTTRLNLSFLPSEGPGRYVVGLVVDGTRAAEVAFDADDAGASGKLSFEVADAPSYLNLSADDVNADGKTKSPGEALLTRARVEDANGLGDLEGVLWLVARGNETIEQGILPLGPPDATSASLEHRYDRAPLAAGNHTLTLGALKGGAVVASASRTFVIREVAPTFVSGALANVTPDENATQEAAIVLADKNGMPSGALEARVYRGSARMEGAGLVATLAAPTRLADADGAGRASYPLKLAVPRGASPGLHRVSLYADGALLASIPFEVLPLPTLASVNATVQGATLLIEARGAGHGFLRARLDDGQGASASHAVRLDNGTGALSLDPPRRGVELRWTLTLHAREDGPALAERNGTWRAPLDGPALRLAPLHVRARLPAAWSVEAPWGLDGANATFSFARWDGTPETRLEGRLVAGRARIEGPPDLDAGRYRATMRLAWPNGSASESSWTFDAGPWVQLELGPAVVEGREARVPVRNTGGLAVTRLLVEVEPEAAVTLQVANATAAARDAGGRTAFSGFRLAPGEEAGLLVRLPEGALRSGRHEVALRVLARIEVG